MAFKTNSLAFRLAVFAGLWSLIVLVGAAVFLSSVYRQTVEDGFERELQLYLNNLVAVLQFDENDRLQGQPDLQDARFQAFGSGWYWQIGRPDKDGLIGTYASQSLAGEMLDVPDALDIPYDAEFTRSFPLEGPEEISLLIVQRQVLIDDKLATVLIAGSLDDVEDAVSRFQQVLFVFLGLFGASLIGGTLVVVWLGLKPLGAISRALNDIRGGRAERLDGEFPSEIEPLAAEVNALITTNQDVVERARTHVGNLAHALKTPLSVLSNDASSNAKGLAASVSKQTEAMRRQIDYYLQRARVAGAVTVVGASHPIDETLDALLRTLAKINRDRGISVSRTGIEGVMFRGEAQDFEEIVGNLLENAFKWAKSEISVSVSTDDQTPMHRPGLTLIIADDGPGLAPEDRETAIKRGQRLDEQTPGTGLGLSIVADLVALYGGVLSLETADIGGLAVRVILPKSTG